jgi:hypothetical protein
MAIQNIPKAQLNVCQYQHWKHLSKQGHRISHDDMAIVTEYSDPPKLFNLVE